jgi:hypothetical protein
MAVSWKMRAEEDAGITFWMLTPALLLAGSGAGLVFIPLADLIIGDVTTAEVGSAVGVLNAAQQFAGAIGVAALARCSSPRPGTRPPVPASPPRNCSSASPPACTS